MYKRYYDGYGTYVKNSGSAEPNADKQPASSSIPIADYASNFQQQNSIKSKAVQSALPPATVQSSNNTESDNNGTIAALSNSPLSAFGLGGLQLDDIILIGVIILMFTESNTVDTPLLLIIAFIFIAGFIGI